MSKRSSRKSRQERAKRASERGSQNPRAPEGDQKILAELAALDQEKSLDGPAGACARAREANIDPTIRSARIALIVDLFGKKLWQPGVTAWELAKLWPGLKGETIENDASIAKLVIDIASDKSAVLPRFWASTLSLLDRAEGMLATAESIFARHCAAGGDSLRPDEMMALSTALGRFSDNVDKALDRVGKASGALTTGSAVEVHVNVSGQKVPASKAAELAAKAHAFFDQELERRLRARCPGEPQLAAEVLAWFLEYVGVAPVVDVVDVPVLQSGGG